MGTSAGDNDAIRREKPLTERLDRARRTARRYVAAIVAAGASGGALLIWLAGEGNGYGSRLADGVGVGLIVAALVAAVTPKAAAYYDFAYPSRSDIVLDQLDGMLDLLEEFVIDWKSNQLADETERQNEQARFKEEIRNRVEMIRNRR